VARLVELMALISSDAVLEFTGQAAQWLFDDVKATWIHGYFTGTVLTAHAFCAVQLAGAIRLVSDDPIIPIEPSTLEEIAQIGSTVGVIDVDLEARLIELDELAGPYRTANLRADQRLLERRVAAAEEAGGDHPLLTDARRALVTAVDLLQGVGAG
jgi:hypothetical protein